MNQPVIWINLLSFKTRSLKNVKAEFLVVQEVEIFLKCCLIAGFVQQNGLILVSAST